MTSSYLSMTPSTLVSPGPKVLHVDRALRKGFALLFLIFCFFPYITPIDTGTDTQPYSLVFAILLFFTFKLRFNFGALLLLMSAFSAFFFAFIFGVDFSAARSLFNYLSLFFVFYVTHKLISANLVNFEKFILLTFIAWVFVGVVQLFIGSQFVSVLIPGARFTDDRGVISLAAEPSFFGLIMVFYILFFIKSSIKYKSIYMFLAFLSVALLARSAIALLFVIYLVSLRALLSGWSNFLKGSIFIAFSAVVIFHIADVGESRILTVFKLVIENPESILLVDASINHRVFNIFFAFLGFFENLGLPGGFNTWLDFSSEKMTVYGNYVLAEGLNSNGRIMSGFGAAFYELGVLAFFIIFAMLFFFNGGFVFKYRNLSSVLFDFIFIFTVMLMAIPIGFSFFSMYLAFSYAKMKERNLDDIDSNRRV